MSTPIRSNRGPALRTFPNATARRSTDVPISEERLSDFDDLLKWFSENDNREVYDMVVSTPDEADLLIRQVKQYARVNRLSSRPEQDEGNPCKVTFRFVPKRDRSDDSDVAGVVAE